MRKLIFWAIVGLLALVQLGFADNQSVQLFTPPDTDQSVQYLGAIFGVVTGVLHGVGTQIVAVMFGVFNSAVLALCGIIVTYTLLVSTLNTAHEDEVMGKKWSSIWIPVRSAVGVALLLPKTTGYSFIQVFIMWVVVQGVGVADAIWDSALNYISQGGVIIQSTFNVKAPGVNSSTSKNMIALMRSQVCLYGLQSMLEKQRNQAVLTGQTPTPPPVPLLSQTVDLATMTDKVTPGETVTRKIPNLGDTGYYKSYSGACGEVSWQPSIQSSSDANQSNNPYAENDETVAKGPRTIALEQLLLGMSDGAQAIVTNFTEDKPMEIGSCKDNKSCGYKEKAWNEDSEGNVTPALMEGNFMRYLLNDYVGVISPALRQVTDQNALSWISEAKEKGWILAGSYYYRLSLVNNNATVQMDSSFPTVTQSWDDTNFCDSKSPFSGLNSDCDTLKAWLYSDTTYNNEGLSLPKFLTDSMTNFVLPYTGEKPGGNDDKSVSSTSVSGKLSKVFKPIIGPILDIPKLLKQLHNAQESNDNPLLSLSKLGYSMLSLVTEIWLAGLTAAVVVLAIGGVPSVSLSTGLETALLWLLPFVTLVMALMFVAGCFLALYLPLLPFLMFTLGAIGWFIGVIEAMVAAPLVAVGILHPDGQHEVFGKSDQGVMLLLNVFLRPGMMVIGFIFGISLSYVGVWLLNEGLARGSELAYFDLSSSFSAVWWYLGLIVIYCAAVVTIVTKAFSLIHVIPDKVLRWLSGGIAESLGAESAGQMDTIKGTTMSAAQQTGQAAGKSLEQGAMQKGEGKPDESGSSKTSGEGGDGGGSGGLQSGGASGAGGAAAG